MHLRFLWIVLAAALAACGATTPSPSPTSTPGPTNAPTSTPGGSADPSKTIVLRLAQANTACDAIGVDYRKVTFRIDPSASDQVTAIADTGKALSTYWVAGFQPGTAAERVIRDPAGQVVATDGEVLAIPEGAWPNLHGHMVCPTPDALYVLLVAPS